MTERLVIVDGHNILYRSYYAMANSNLLTQFGEPTGALFGTVQALRGYLRELGASHMVWFFDQGRSSFRTALRDTYKGHRKYASTAAPIVDPQRDVPPQAEAFRTFLDLYGVSHHSEDGVEADDLVAAAVLEYEPNIEIVIVSGDHDLLQLVTDRVAVFRPGEQPRHGSAIGLRVRAALYGPNQVRERYGVRPDQLATLWALTGDTGDNIEGIPGVGEKTAAKWIDSYGDNLSWILATEPRCEGYERRCWVNYQLIHLDGTVGTVPFDLPTLRLPRANASPLQPIAEFFERWEMTSLLESFVKENGW